MIRRIKSEDIEEIVKLENEVLNTTLGSEILTLAIRSEMAYYYVYLDDNRIVGYISSSFDGTSIEILNFCVYKEYQKKGIGTKLITHLLDELYLRGANNSVLEVRESNTNAISFYERIGYKTIHVRKNYYSNGENALMMQKLLTPYEDISRSYYDNFAKIENHKEYISYRNDEFKEKYDYNKYVIIDENNLDKVMKRIKKDNNRKFLELITSSRHNDYFIDMVESYCGIMHANISTIRIDVKHNDVRELTKDYLDDYVKYCYNEDLMYDEEYAKLNGKFRGNVILNKKEFKSYLIYEGDKLIGILDAYVFLDTAFFENFSILEEYRMQGYGSSLFMKSIEMLKNEGIHDLYLEVDNYDTPKDMYKKWGFKAIGSYYGYHEDY